MLKTNSTDAPKKAAISGNASNLSFYNLKDLINQKRAKLTDVISKLDDKRLTDEQRQQLLASKQQISSEIDELESSLTVVTTKQQEQMLHRFEQNFFQSDNERELF